MRRALPWGPGTVFKNLPGGAGAGLKNFWNAERRSSHGTGDFDLKPEGGRNRKRPCSSSLTRRSNKVVLLVRKCVNGDPLGRHTCMASDMGVTPSPPPHPPPPPPPLRTCARARCCRRSRSSRWKKEEAVNSLGLEQSVYFRRFCLGQGIKFVSPPLK